MSNITILNLQKSLILKKNKDDTNTNIVADIIDKSVLIVKNLTADNLQTIELVVNNPSNNNGYITLQKVEIFLNNNIHPTIVYGFSDIIKSIIKSRDTTAYGISDTTHQPFEASGAFKGGHTNVLQLLTLLSQQSHDSPTITSVLNPTFNLTFK
jgi:hypothetical protein